MVNIFVSQLFTCSAHGEQEGRYRFSLQNADKLYLLLAADSVERKKMREDVLDTVTDTLRTLRYYVAACHMLQTAIKIENIFKKRNGETEAQLYWKDSIRRSLRNVMHILKPGNGVLAKYVASNGCVTRVSPYQQQQQTASADFPEEL